MCLTSSAVCCQFSWLDSADLGRFYLWKHNTDWKLDGFERHINSANLTSACLINIIPILLFTFFNWVIMPEQMTIVCQSLQMMFVKSNMDRHNLSKDHLSMSLPVSHLVCTDQTITKFKCNDSRYERRIKNQAFHADCILRFSFTND